LVFSGIDIFRLAEGKIVERWGIVDTVSLLYQIGAMALIGTWIRIRTNTRLNKQVRFGVLLIFGISKIGASFRLPLNQTVGW